ncbi:MAG: trigger factor [Firmicutes bacterium]|nr:trigger factor [Bacillota bacterium]
MKATADRIEKNTVVMEVEVDAEKFDQALSQAYKKLVKQVNVPGFRRGKAPRRVVESYVGKAALYNEAVELVIPDAYVEALEETGVEPIEQPEVELLHVEEGEPVKFKATVKVKPEVELGDYKELEVTQVPVEIGEEEVDEELEKLRNKHAQLVTLDEGNIKKGDMATIDFTGRVDGEEFEGGQASDYALEIGSGSFIPGFEDQLEGMAVGETKVISVTFPEDYQNKDLAGKETEFTVTLKGLKRKELSALDDEFAKDVSEFDTLEELRADVLNNLKQAAQDRAKQEMRTEAITKAVDNATVEIPAEMVDSQVDQMKKDMEQRLMSQGLSIEDYLKYTESNMEQLEENLRPEAERSEKTALVLDTIARQEQIEVNDEDMENKIEEMAGQYQQDSKTLKKILESQNQLDYLKGGITREKTVDFLLKNAIIVPGTKEEAKE